MSLGVGAGVPQFVQEVTINPVSVGADSIAAQTFTVNGLQTYMLVLVNMPDIEAGLGIVGVACSAANTLKIWFKNDTGAGIDPASQVIKVVGL